MRQSTAVNHENEYLMNGILRQMSSIYGNALNPYMVAKFVGVLLVLRKHEAFENVGRNNLHTSLLNVGNVKMSDDILSLVLGTIEEVKSITPLEKFDAVIGMIKVSEFSQGEYLRWYDYFLEELTAKNKLFSLFSAPETFATLVDAFLLKGDNKIFNPFGGIMRLATDMERYVAMDACEINRDVWALGMLRVELSGYTDKISYSNRNIESWTSKQYDAIVAMPPFNAKIQMKQSSSFVRSNSPEEMENVAISRFVGSTTPDGCCITFVSPSVLWSVGEKARMREWATKNRFVDTIILLPKNLLASTNIPVVCLVLRKKSLHKDGVRMIDASDLFTNHQYKNYLSIGDIMNVYHKDTDKVSATISFEQIEENDFSWNVADYLNQKEVDCPDGYTLARIEDIIHFPDVKRSTDYHSGNVIQISDLSDDWTRPYVDVEAIDRKDALRGCAMVTEDAVLLSTIRTLKPSIVKASADKPVFVNQNILVAIPNEGIDAEYLCMVLAKTDIPTIGMGAPHISKTRLLRQQIAYPSLEQQRSTYQEARHAAMLEQVKALHLEEVLDRRITEFKNEVRSRKHDMRPYIRELGSIERLIRSYITKKESMEDFSGKMLSLMDKYHVTLTNLSDLIEVFSEEQQFGEPEKFNINKYFVELEINHDETAGYWIEYDRDDNALSEYGIPIPVGGIYDENLMPIDPDTEDYDELIDEINKFPLIVDINHLDFERLVRNIIDNAVTHGFADTSRSDYGIGIDLTIDEEKGMFQIDFSNNGTPLPAGMNKQRYGILGEKAGSTGRTGRGGYVVKSIVEHYHGDYDVFMDGKNTVIRVLLPIAPYDYEYEYE